MNENECPVKVKAQYYGCKEYYKNRYHAVGINPFSEKPFNKLYQLYMDLPSEGKEGKIKYDEKQMHCF